MSQNQTDISWWNAFKEGDRTAFDNLFRQYYPVLLLYGLKISQDRDVVDDCIQDLFIELWQSKASPQIQSVKAYLLKALKYKLFRQFKLVQPVQHSGDDQQGVPFELSHDHFIINRDDERSRATKITTAVNKLPNRQKEIIYLKIYQSLSYEEISEVMSINYQVARNLFHQSIKSLREMIEFKV